jgi:hypothetical protein
VEITVHDSEVIAPRFPRIAPHRRSGMPAGRHHWCAYRHPSGGIAHADCAGHDVGVPSRVETFLDAHADRLADVVKTGARQKLSDAITALDTHASDQSGGLLAAQGATQKKDSLRQALLRDHMAKIARIAAADLPSTPELEPLRMPKGKPTAEKLAALAAGMANTAEPYSSVFIAAGLPTDFIAQLKAATDAMTGTIAERTSSRGRRSGATVGLKQKLSDGRKIVHILDAFVKSALKDDPALLRNWDLVKRVPRPTGRSAPSPAQSSPTPQTPGPGPSTPAPSEAAPSAPAVPSPEPPSVPTSDPSAMPAGG